MNAPKWMVMVSVFIFIASAFATTGEQSFTPTSILIPIRGIEVKGSSGGAHGTVYDCKANTESGCLVDIADSSALEALVSSSKAEVQEGSYDTIRIYTCKDEGSYNAKLKGTVTIGSSTYLTGAGSNPLGGSGSPDYVIVPFSGCATDFYLPKTLEIKKGASDTVSLFVTLTDIAWATNNGGTTIPSGCKSDGTNGVCMAYPNLVPYIGTTTPSLEAYHLRNSSTAAGTEGGQMLLFFDLSDNLLGGTTRRLYSANSVSIGNFDTPLRIFEKNSDGTYHLENYGSSATTSYFSWPSFSRSSHGGTYTPTGESSTAYTAVKK